MPGGRAAINFVRSLRDMLAGESRSSVNMTVKWDGAPAIFAGEDPSDGKFFVAKKSVFNATPKLYKTAAEIDEDGLSGALNTKFKVALEEFSKLGIKGVLQGDLMFTSEDKGKEKIDGKSFITFQPNTIVYAVDPTSDIGKSILSEVALIINDCLLPLLSLVSQSITIFTIITLLVYADPKTAVTAFLMIGVCYLSIFFLLKKKLSELGSQRLESNSKRFLAINETFAAIKEIKISNIEKKCSELFLNPAKEYSKKLTLANAISILPRYFLEIIAVVGIVAFILVLLSSGK